MSRRTTAGLLALGLAAVLLFSAALEPVAYVTFRPGPTVDVLKEYDGKKIIEIKGRKTYDDGGSLRMVTIYPSGPDDDLSLLTVMEGWISSETAVLPKGAVYKKAETNETVRKESAIQMSSSQDNAKVAALEAAGIPYRRLVQVASVDPKGASAKVLKVGDQLLEVNGKPVTDEMSVVSAIRPLPDKSTVTLKILRKGKVRTVAVRTRLTEVELSAPTPEQERCPDGSPVATEKKKVSLIGVTPAARFVYPFKMDINLGDNIGGPSAGMMFALTIYDLLTKGSLTGGKSIAGSGEISTDGTVGPIGGIGQKLVGAQRDGARLFLVASENWEEAIHSEYDKDQLTLVRVHTIDDAVKAINTWRENPDADLPECGR